MAPEPYSLEDYLRDQYAPGIGRIDFAFRAAVTDEAVEIYIHPTRDGLTTPTLLVQGNTIVVKPGQAGYLPMPVKENR
jgi:hypothetical protein